MNDFKKSLIPKDSKLSEALRIENERIQRKKEKDKQKLKDENIKNLELTLLAKLNGEEK